MTDNDSQAIPLCNSADLQEGGLAVPFDVVYGGQPLSAPGAAAGEGLPGVAARTAHLTQVVGLVWRTVALWLLLLVLLTLARVLA